MEELKTKKKLSKGMLLIIGLLVLVVGVTAGILIANIPTTLTVNEALATATSGIGLTGFPGETFSASIEVLNQANVPLNVEATWTETDNINGVVYITNMPLTISLVPGWNLVDVNFVIADDSPTGDINGNVQLTRVV